MSERLLIRYPLFELLPPDTLHSLLTESLIVEFETGEVLFQEGTAGAWVHVLLEGRVRILRKTEAEREISLGIVRDGDLFGEYVLLAPHLNTATCRAAARCRVLRIPVTSVRNRLREVGVDGPALKQLVRLHAAIHFATGRHYLGFMSASSALTFSDCFQQEHFRPMRTLRAPGLAQDRWFLMTEGQATLSDRFGRNLELGPGDCFGSLCLTGRPSEETVSTLSETRCLSLRVSDFTIPSAPAGIETARSEGSMSSDGQQTRFSRPVGKLQFPFCSQLHESDCGLAALTMVTEYFGFATKDRVYQQLPELNQNGISLLQLRDLTRALDFSADAYRIDSDHLADLQCPFIAHLNDGHFLVVYSANENSVLVADPATSLHCISNDSLKSRWSGYALFIRISDKN